MIVLFYYHALFNLENELEFEKSKISKQNCKSKLSRYNKKFTQVILIMRSRARSQRQTSFISSFWLLIAVTTSQKQQNDWKNLRNLSKHSYILCSNHREITRKQWFRSIYFQFRAFERQNIKNFFKNWLNNDYKKNITKYSR